MRTEPSQKFLEKYLNIKFYELRLVAARLFHTHGWTDRQTDLKKLTVALCNSATVPKMSGGHITNNTYFFYLCVINDILTVTVIPCRQ